MNNHVKTFFLLMSITVLFMLLGLSFGGLHGMIIAMLFAIIINFFSYWFSDRIILKIYGAKEVDQRQFPELYQIVRSLVLHANMSMPKICLIEQNAPNAFATGRNAENSVVVLTKGLIKIMSEEELTGVLAHELAHIKNKDILIGTMVATMAGAIMMLASMVRWSVFFGSRHEEENEENSGLSVVGLVIMSILAPITAKIIQMAVSRNREYLADATGTEIAGKPNGLANALQKLETYSVKVKLDVSPATAHMFIINPLSGSGGNIENLFATHPSVSERVRRLLDGKKDRVEKSNSKRKKRDTNNIGKEFWSRLDN